MRCVITGGTGFIGSNLALHLIERGDTILITGHDTEQKLPPFKGKYLQPTFLGFDWENMRKVDVLFHQAAINDTTNMDRDQMLKANYESSKQLFEKMVDVGCKKIVYASSTAVYGDLPVPYKEHGPLRPLNPYAESKKALDKFAMNFTKEHPDVTIVGLRYSNVYGPREDHKGKRASMIYQLAQQMLHNNPRIFKYGEQKRDYVYVKDVIEANMLATKAKESCIVNCGYGSAITFNDVIKILNEVMGTNRKPEYIDNPYADRYQSHTECDMTLAKEKIGFMPKFDIREGIKDYHKSGFLVKNKV